MLDVSVSYTGLNDKGKIAIPIVIFILVFLNILILIVGWNFDKYTHVW